MHSCGVLAADLAETKSLFVVLFFHIQYTLTAIVSLHGLAVCPDLKH